MCGKTKSNLPRIICHGCYANDDHILPECKYSLADPDFAMHNYEAFTPEEESCVPDKYYLAAKTLVKGTPENS